MGPAEMATPRALDDLRTHTTTSTTAPTTTFMATASTTTQCSSPTFSHHCGSHAFDSQFCIECSDFNSTIKQHNKAYFLLVRFGSKDVESATPPVAIGSSMTIQFYPAETFAGFMTDQKTTRPTWP